jgi:hypothetical protein
LLIHEETSEALDVLYGAFFDLNATLDRVASVMLNDFSMPNAGEIVHLNISHTMPLLADVVSEIKDNYNLSSIRPEVHKDDRNYSNLSDMFSTVLKEFSEVYEIMNKVVDIAIAHRDRNVTSDMYRLFRKYNIIMGQVNTLNDKAQQMPTDFDKFDFNISKWGIKGVKL